MYITTDKKYLMIYLDGQDKTNTTPNENPPAFEELLTNVANCEISEEGFIIPTIFYELSGMRGFTTNTARQLVDIINAQGPNNIEWDVTFMKFGIGEY